MPLPLTKEKLHNIFSSRFINDKFKTLASLPSFKTLKDINKATLRVKRAIENKEKIVIAGDYDADGVISSTIMYEFFKQIGVNVEVVIPNRFKDGYGLNKTVLERINADLIITVDNGIGSVEAAKLCKEKGIDLIITDHHNPGSKLPDAYAIVNPKQVDCEFPYKDMCGAQVAWYFLASLKAEMSIDIDLSAFLDLVTIAIIADMVDLRCLNRAMAKKGIKYLNRSNRFVMVALKQRYKKENFTFTDIGFLIAPLINSAGRLEDASVAFKFLTSTSLQEAEGNLEYLISLNDERKQIQNDIYDLALKNVSKDKNIIVVYGDDWHEGVLGIVASKLTREFKRPSIVLSINGDMAKGSARGIGNFDLFSSINEHKHFLLGFGGHKSAAGMSLLRENLEDFKQALEKSTKNVNEDIFTEEGLLGELDLKYVDLNLLELMEEFEPFGMGNKRPVFSSTNLLINDVASFGKLNAHMKYFFNNSSVEAIMFYSNKIINKNEKVDISFTVSKNEFRGNVSAQVLLETIENTKGNNV